MLRIKTADSEDTMVNSLLLSSCHDMESVFVSIKLHLLVLKSCKDKIHITLNFLHVYQKGKRIFQNMQYIHFFILIQYLYDYLIYEKMAVVVLPSWLTQFVVCNFALDTDPLNRFNSSQWSCIIWFVQKKPVEKHLVSYSSYIFILGWISPHTQATFRSPALLGLIECLKIKTRTTR